ncbi:MAG: phosphate ABC transporter ATP-binding protein [Chloroflexota bacterium]
MVDTTSQPKIQIDGVSVFYDSLCALQSITLPVMANEILTIFGPARGGKTTLLRTLNRLNDLTYSARMTGEVLLDGENINQPGYSVIDLRRRVGMVFDLPLALPMSIFENVAYGPRLMGIRKRSVLAEIVESALVAAAMWDEVKDRLDTSGLSLSGGQQQRLSIARVLALRPEVILLDEPTSGLDPISTAKIEDSLRELKQEYTIIMVPHNVQQAARIADRAAFFLMGELVEYGTHAEVFSTPKDKRTEDYITGRFG